jgi:hypothetical protein
MKHNLVRNLTVIVGLLIIAVFVFGAVGYSSPAVAASPAKQAADVEEVSFVSNKEFLAEGKATSKPWTLERMAAAKPADLLTIDGSRQLTIDPLVADGDPGLIPASMPGNEKVSFAAEEDLALFSGISPLGYSYPAPYTRYNFFTSYKRWPYHVAGVLFFSYGGGDWRCSASSIGNYAIWTAGHCVEWGAGGGWASNWVFVPGYANGKALKGIWYGYTAWTTTAWANNSDERYDYGGVILDTLGGLRISQVVGNWGFAWNWTRQLAWMAIGWPAESPFSGAWQAVCASSFAYADASFGSPNTKGIGCDQTGGASGGPWVWKFYANPTNHNYLNGNTTYRYVGYPEELFSPHFDTDTYNFWSTIVADTP